MLCFPWLTIDEQSHNVQNKESVKHLNFSIPYGGPQGAWQVWLHWLKFSWIIQNVLSNSKHPPKPNHIAFWCSMELGEWFGKVFLVYCRCLSSKWNHISKFLFWNLVFKKISEMFYGVVHCFTLPKFIYTSVNVFCYKVISHRVFVKWPSLLSHQESKYQVKNLVN